MIEEVIYTPQAKVDVAESYQWYEGRALGLGEDFLRCIEACVSVIQRYPEAFPLAKGDFRHAPIRRFPFEIFYEPLKDQIVIYSVFHSSQDPRKWHKRLGLE